MNAPEIAALVDQYRAGLEAEIVILHRLEESASQQRAAALVQDMRALHEASDNRDALMAGPVSGEDQLRVVREKLAQSRERVRGVPGYAEAVALHREALGLVSRILHEDAESVEALAAAELARRDAARAVEQGETTLAAYRRVMTRP